MSEVILYDLPSKGHCACWSLNPWKTRLVLNFKGIPYKTEWVEYPDIAPTMKSFGLLPNAEGTPYTIPALRIYSDKYIMDSLKIAKELELRYPSPSLYLDSPILPKVMDIIPNILETMRGALMPKIPPTLLNPSSAEYFEETRAKRFGKPLAQLEKENSGDTAWLEVTPVLNELGHILRAEGGPFALGKTVSYADLVIVGALQFIKRIGEDLFERAMRIEPALKKLYDASEGWLERDDH